MDGLDDEQRRAVRLLQEISNTTDDDVAVGVLSSVDWDIQVTNKSSGF
jgi:FAS-associated factor 2